MQPDVVQNRLQNTERVINIKGTGSLLCSFRPYTPAHKVEVKFWGSMNLTNVHMPNFIPDEFVCFLNFISWRTNSYANFFHS